MMLKAQFKAKGHRSLRLGRCSQENGIYLITSVTWQRTPIFSQWTYARAAIKAFTEDKVLKDTQLLCWVLMPDHVHWLIQLGAERDLSQLVGAMKSASSRAVHSAGYKNEVWASGFHDRAIRKEEDITPAARYIVANPLRAGLVKQIGDYPYWDAIYL